MLRELLVENLGVIEAAELELSPGMSALTGETGAGKTLLVAALGLLLGGRADRERVRDGADRALIQGRFEVAATSPGVDFLAAHEVLDLPDEDATVELVLTRSVTADGRSKARVNGRLVATAMLAGAGRHLVEIAGQHEHQQLGRPSFQRALLDAFAGPEAVALAREVSATARMAAEAERRAKELEESERERARERDLIAYEVEEIEAAKLRPGEIEELDAAIARLANAEEAARGIAEAVVALRGDGGATETLATARARIEAVAAADAALAEQAERLDVAYHEVADVADELVRAGVEPDPAALDELHARLDGVRRLLRKYGPQEDDVLHYLAEARRRAAALASSDEELREARERHQAMRARAEELAGRLSQIRREAAPRLASTLEDHLARLAMAGTRVEVELDPRALYDGGHENVQLRVVTDPGASPRALTKVASGGELSRIALAARLAGAPSNAATMVFDEVDAGVGGEAARSVGHALAQLGRTSQVLVVTHLPQVAAFADGHYRVDRTTRAGRAQTRVAHVQGEERVEELSRMLAGLRHSETARDHARELLEMASDTV